MKLKPIVMIDLDGVVADFNTKFLQLSRKLLAKPHKNFVVTDFDYTKCGWTESEVKRIFNYIRHNENFWETLEVLPQTGSIRKHETDCNLIFVTSRVSTDGLPVAYQSEEWLRSRCGLSSPYVIVSSDKGTVANDIEADWAIDDKIENVVEIATARPSCKVFLQDASYNKALSDTHIERIESLNEFFKRVTKG